MHGTLHLVPHSSTHDDTNVTLVTAQWDNASEAFAIQMTHQELVESMQEWYAHLRADEQDTVIQALLKVGDDVMLGDVALYLKERE